MRRPRSSHRTAATSSRVDPGGPPDEASSTRDWAGALTLPRVTSLRHEGGLTQVPAEELARLRSSRRHSLKTAPRTPLQVPVSDQFELLASLTPVRESTVGIAIFDDDGPEPEARIPFRPDQRRVSVTRRGTVEVGGPDESNVMIIPPDEPSVLDLRVIVDGSVMGRSSPTAGRRRRFGYRPSIGAAGARPPSRGCRGSAGLPGGLVPRACRLNAPQGRILPDGVGFLLRLIERTCVPLRPRSLSCDRGSLAVVVRGDDHQLLSRSTRDQEM